MTSLLMWISYILLFIKQNCNRSLTLIYDSTNIVILLKKNTFGSLKLILRSI